MKLNMIILSSIILSSTTAVAHEDHTHSEKMEIVGVLQKGTNLSLKLVQEASDLKFYPLSLDGKAIPISEIKISATATPRKEKPEELSLTEEKAFFSAKYTAKTLTTLNVLAIYKNKKNQMSFKVDSE